MAPRPLMHVVAEQQKELNAVKAQNAWLYQAVNRLATVAGLRPVTADETNPAQPIPAGGSEAPYTTLEQERQPGARGDVTQIGGVPGATDVGADSTTTVDQIGGVNADTPYNVSENVTDAVAGTEGPRPLDEVRTIPEIQFGNPLKPDAAFPLQGEWAGKATTGSQARTFASLRLAKLRMEAGITSETEELVLAQRIANDVNMPDGAIQNEIETLGQVIKAQASRPAAPAPAPRRVQAARSVPSMASMPSLSTTASADEEFALFE